MKSLKKLFTIFALLAGLAPVANAGIIYSDNAGTAYTNAIDITHPNSAADDFTLSEDAVLETVTFWAVSTDATVFSDFASGSFQFSYVITGDAGGAVDFGNIIDFGDVTGGSVLADGGLFFGFDVYQVTFALTAPLKLDAGTTYWLGLQSHFSETRDVSWLDHSPIEGNGAVQDAGTASYVPYGADAAFFLEGAVPEPSTVVILGLGLLVARRFIRT